MRNTKGNEKPTSNEKVSASQSPKPKRVTRTTKSIAVNKENSRSLAGPAGDEHDAGSLHSLSEYSASLSEEATQAQIAKRAYELYEQRGRQHGEDQADWFQAAKEALAPKYVG
jgi:hypothetical protein